MTILSDLKGPELRIQCDDRCVVVCAGLNFKPSGGITVAPNDCESCFGADLPTTSVQDVVIMDALSSIVMGPKKREVGSRWPSHYQSKFVSEGSVSNSPAAPPISAPCDVLIEPDEGFCRLLTRVRLFGACALRSEPCTREL